MMRLNFLLFLLLGASPLFSQTIPYENLVFEGAGIRGLAYSGVVLKLEEYEIMPRIKRVGGTSAGAITALMLAIGYDAEEMYTIISGTKFQKFNDGQFMFMGGLHRMKRSYGWYKGHAFNAWLENLIEQKTGDKNITFSQLKEKGYKELYVTGTCLNRQKLLVFSAETYPEMRIKDAVRISMSVPLYFEAVFIDSEGQVHKKQTDEEELDVMVDGGVIGNFPIFIFDSIQVIDGKSVRLANPKTIGIRIDDERQIESDRETRELVPSKIDNLGDYLNAFYVMILENLNRNTLTDADWERTISVSSVGISPRIKKLSPQQKQAFMDSGENYTLLFLEKHGLKK